MSNNEILRMFPPLAIGADGDNCGKFIETAIKYGFRFFDSAYMYESEKVVGNIVSKFIMEGINRSDFFIQSKAPHNKVGYNSTLVEFNNTLKKMNLTYLDSYLIHYPQREHDNWRELTIDKWRALEKLYLEGKVHRIGVSNFLPHHLDFLMQEASIKPMVNQIELHPLKHQDYTVAYCRENNIAIQAWSPLGSGRCFYNPILKQLAAKYQCSILSFVLSWHYKKGYIPIVGGFSEQELIEISGYSNVDISNEDMEVVGKIKEDSTGCHTETMLVDWIPSIPQKKLAQQPCFTSRKIIYKLFGIIPIFKVEELSPDRKKFYFFNILICKILQSPITKKKNWSKCEKESGNYKIESVFNDNNVFLECPVWDKKNNIIYCIAPFNEKIYSINMLNSTFEVIPTTKGVIGAIDLSSEGILISAEETGIYKLDLKNNVRQFLVQLKPEIKYNFRQNNLYYNDGKLDAKGRFVVGTTSPFNNNRLYSFDGTSSKILENNIGVSNGIAWNKNNTVMYYIDSDTKKVAKYNYNIETGDAFFDSYVIEFSQGTPDGMCIDEHDNLWIAEFDGQRVSKWETKNYTKIDEINFPVWVTSCCLGGANEEYLYVTTCQGKQSKKSSGLFRIKIK